jgi:hypothetical protein
MCACTCVVTQRMTPDSRKDMVMLNVNQERREVIARGPNRGGMGNIVRSDSEARFYNMLGK